VVRHHRNQRRSQQTDPTVEEQPPGGVDDRDRHEPDRRGQQPPGERGRPQLVGNRQQRLKQQRVGREDREERGERRVARDRCRLACVHGLVAVEPECHELPRAEYRAHREDGYQPARARLGDGSTSLHGFGWWLEQNARLHHVTSSEEGGRNWVDTYVSVLRSMLMRCRLTPKSSAIRSIV
jgi:hypothetical protein